MFSAFLGKKKHTASAETAAAPRPGEKMLRRLFPRIPAEIAYDSLVAEDLLTSVFETPEFSTSFDNDDVVPIEAAWPHGPVDEILQDHFLPMLQAAMNYYVVGQPLRLGWSMRNRKCVLTQDDANFFVNPPWTWTSQLFTVGRTQHISSIQKHLHHLEHQVARHRQSFLFPLLLLFF